MIDKKTEKERLRHPEWIRARLGRTERYGAVRGALAHGGLHTVCEEARCPNRGECWDAGTATFLILGDVCTRACRYCGVRRGAPAPPDPEEPQHLLEAVKRLRGRYVVITSVTRDDLPDGGAAHFAAVVRTLKINPPDIPIELLIPDFGGDADSLRRVADAQPAVLGHNIETVRRLFPSLRPQGDYDRSLALLARAAEEYPLMPVKSGLMIGLGETRDEISQALRDLHAAGARLVTVGQYLQPSRECVPVERYPHPDEFDEIRDQALALGFASALCGPLVRSSYHAESSFREKQS
jgi:lipoyl synthase